MGRIAKPALYDRDFYAWTQQQAAALRRLKGLNHGDLDIDHLAEEIADLGKREQRALRSHVHQMLRHLIKLAWSTAAEPRTAWAREIRDNRRQALEILAQSPGLRGEADPAALWSAAVADANGDLTDYGEPPFPAETACPVTRDSLLAGDFDPYATAQRIAESAGQHR